MAVRRPRPARRPRPPRVTGTYQATLGSVGGGRGGDLLAAADEIADMAREIASGFSVQIPPSIDVSGDDLVVTISADAPPAYPAETRSRHPLFGNREHWYGPPGARFLVPAADIRAGAAMARYAKKIDRLAREAGFGA